MHQSVGTEGGPWNSLRKGSELKECDPVDHSLAHLGSSEVGEGHQEHDRGTGPRVLLQWRDRLHTQEHPFKRHK